MPGHYHLVPARRVDASQDQRLAIVGPAHVREGGRAVVRVRERAGPGLPPDEEVLVLSVSGVAVHDQAERKVVVINEVHHRGLLHLGRLFR